MKMCLPTRISITGVSRDASVSLSIGGVEVCFVFGCVCVCGGVFGFFLGVGGSLWVWMFWF